jgi:hypothetical protein
MITSSVLMPNHVLRLVFITNGKKVAGKVHTIAVSRIRRVLWFLDATSLGIMTLDKMALRKMSTITQLSISNTLQ